MSETVPPIYSEPARNLKKIIVVIAIGGIVLAGVAGGLGYRHFARERSLSAKRIAAIQLIASNSRDVEGAISDLKEVVARRPDDAEAWAMLARAVLHRSPAARQNVIDSLRYFNSALEHGPDRIEDRAEMVRLLDLVGESDALIRFIIPLIEAKPQDTQLLELKTVHLMRLPRAKELELAAKAWSEAAPGSFRAQLSYVSILSEAGRDQSDPKSFLNRQLAANPNKDLVALVRAAWLLGKKQTADAETIINALIVKPDLDWQLARPLVSILDQIGRRADADRILELAIQRRADESLVAFATLRDIDRANYSRALSRLTDSAKPKDPLSLATQLSLTAFLARQLNQGETSDRAMVELRNLPLEISSGWIAILTAARPEPLEPTTARELLPQLRISALSEDGGTLVQLATANCLMRLDQVRNADRILTEASRAPVGWLLCARRLIELRRSQGEVVQAVEVAQFAFNRSGRTIDSAIGLALAVAEVRPTGSQAESHLQLLREIQKVVPGEVQTLGLYVDALAQRNDPTAKTVLADAIKRDSPIPLEYLLRWAEMSQARALGLEAACIDRAVSQFGISPRLALARAMLAHRAGQTVQGLADLRAARAASPGQKRGYDEAIASFLLSTRSPDAAEAWNALAAANPQDVGLQVRVLDLGFGGNAEQKRALIDRIKKIEPGNVAAEVADIRLLIEGRSDRATTDAALLRLNRVVEKSPDMVSARLFLIELLSRTDNMVAALAQWEKANAQTPDELSILFSGVQLLVANGDRSRASEIMRKVERLEANLTTPLRYDAARAYLALGNAVEAAGVLKPISELSRPGQLLLAEAYYRAGNAAETKTLLTQLLESPDLDTLLFAAAVEDSQGNRAATDALLDRAQRLTELSELDRMRMARFASDRGGLDRVVGFLAGTRVSNDFTIRIARLWIEQGEVDAAMKVLNDASSKSADVASLRRRIKEEPQIRGLVALKLNQIASQLLDTPDDLGTRQMVDFALTTQRQSLREQQISLDRLAAMDEGNFALQMFLADRFLAANQPMLAEKHARLASKVEPSSPQPLALAVFATARAGNTGRCAEAIKDWRNRLPADNTQPDAYEARNLARRKEYTELLARFEPRVASMGGKAPLDVFLAMAEAMHWRGRDADAITMLRPLIESDSRISTLWLDLAPQLISASSALQSIEAYRAIVEQRQLPGERVAFAIALDVAARKSRSRTSIDSASTGLSEVEAKANELPIECVVKLATNRVDRGENEIAVDIYRRAIASRVDPSSLEAALAETLRKSGKHAEALQAIDLATARTPDVASFHDTRAVILLDLHRLDESLESALRAQRLDPLNPRWLLRVASLQQLKGDLVTARSALDTLRWFFREPDAWDKDLIDRFLTFEAGLSRRAGPTTSSAVTRPVR